MENCIFCKIVKGEVPSYQVWEDENNLAFLDIRPMKEGHTLVIPKKHFTYLFEMDHPNYQDLLLAAKKVAEILKRTFNPKTGKVGMILYGLDVDHVHLHLSPLDKPGDLTLANSKIVSNEKLKKTAKKIKESL